MARSIKQGVDYFRHDVDMRNDPRIRAVRRKFGLEGYAIYCMLLETMSDNNDISLVENENYLEICAGDYDISPEKLHDIVEYIVTLGLMFRTAETPSKLYSHRLKCDLQPIIDGRNTERERYKRISTAGSTQSRAEQSRAENIKRERHPKTEIAKAVRLSKAEVEKLDAEFGKDGAAARIEKLSLYKQSTGKRYRSDYATILSWERKDHPKPKKADDGPEKTCESCGLTFRARSSICPKCGAPWSPRRTDETA